MIIFMIYYFMNQLFQFFIVGSLFLSIKIFFTKYFSTVISYSALFYDNSQAISFFQNGGFESLFSYFYATVIIFTLLISLGTDIGNTI